MENRSLSKGLKHSDIEIRPAESDLAVVSSKSPALPSSLGPFFVSSSLTVRRRKIVALFLLVESSAIVYFVSVGLQGHVVEGEDQLPEEGRRLLHVRRRLHAIESSLALSPRESRGVNTVCGLQVFRPCLLSIAGIAVVISKKYFFLTL